jgi:hypothetical protein
MLGCSKQLVTDWLAVPRRATPTLERGLKIQELLEKKKAEEVNVAGRRNTGVDTRLENRA